MNVVNFGSLNIDHVYAVDHFCRAGETIHTAGYTQNAGGKGLNQSIAVSRSGQKVHHAGLLGPEGTRLAELLSGSGVDLRYLKHTDVPQGHAVIQVQPDGQNCIFLYGGSNQAVTPQEIDEVLMQLNAGDYLLLQNEIANLTYLLRAAARRGHEHAGDELPLVKVRIEVHAAQGLAREPAPLLVDVDGGDVVLHGVGGGEGLHARDDGDVVLAGAASVENQELQHEKNTSYSS